MKIVFFSNFINHHQYPVAAELYNLAHGQYVFVETEPMPEGFKKGGYPDFSSAPFVLQSWKSRENYMTACDLAINSDVVLFDGIETLPFERLRCIHNPNGLSFEVSERWFKRGFLNLFSPRFIKWYHNYLKYARKCNVYKLCCGAFVANDMYVLGAFRNKCYKWGYITKIESNFEDIERKIARKGPIMIMWCARFLTLKHPEIAIQMANMLKTKGYLFELSIYGGEGNKARGERVFTKDKMQRLIDKYQLSDNVKLKGNLPNSEILKAMSNHDIFLFTSDKHEGWGAVANESLANGCVLVASDAIGSTHYLIDEGVNGFSFKNLNVESLCNKVEWLINNQSKMRNMQLNAYKTMSECWSPQNSARSLFQLLKDLGIGIDSNIKEGPCSKAYPVYNE